MIDDLQQALAAAHIPATIYSMYAIGAYAEPKLHVVEYHLCVDGLFIRTVHRLASPIYDAARGGESYSGDLAGLVQWLADGPSWRNYMARE